MVDGRGWLVVGCWMDGGWRRGWNLAEAWREDLVRYGGKKSGRDGGKKSGRNGGIDASGTVVEMCSGTVVL
jgi:hypothetical protein